MTLDESIKKLECTLLTIEESFARKDIHVNTMTDFKETVIKMCESASIPRDKLNRLIKEFEAKITEDKTSDDDDRRLYNFLKAQTILLKKTRRCCAQE